MFLIGFSSLSSKVAWFKPCFLQTENWEIIELFFLLLFFFFFLFFFFLLFLLSLLLTQWNWTRKICTKFRKVKKEIAKKNWIDLNPVQCWFRQPLERVEYTCSRPLTAVRQRRAWIVPVWVTIQDRVRLVFRPFPSVGVRSNCPRCIVIERYLKVTWSLFNNKKKHYSFPYL